MWWRREEHARERKIRQFLVSWSHSENLFVLINIWLWMTKDENNKISRDTGMHHSMAWSCIKFSSPSRWETKSERRTRREPSEKPPERCVIIIHNFEPIHSHFVYVVCAYPARHRRALMFDIMMNRKSHRTRFEDGWKVEHPTVVKLFLSDWGLHCLPFTTWYRAEEGIRQYQQNSN